MYIVLLVMCSVVAIGCFTYIVVSLRNERRFRRFDRACEHVSQVLRDAHQKMIWASGRDPFNFGRRGEW